MTRFKRIKSILFWIMLANIFVSLAKGIVGYMTGTLSIVADAFHSLTDSTNNIIGLFAISVAGRPPDEDHPYGHGKFETLATVAISALLLIAAYNIVKGAIDRFAHPSEPEVGVISFIVMAVTVIINIIVATYEYRSGKKLKSDLLIADSMHTRSDIFVSLSVIVSLAVMKLGYPIIDPIISLLVGAFIAKAGFDIIKRSSMALTDKAVLDPKEIGLIVSEVPGILGCHGIRTRGTADVVYVDLHCEVDPNLTTQAAHDLATKVEAAVKKQMPGVVDVVVHIEPFNPKEKPVT